MQCLFIEARNKLFLFLCIQDNIKGSVNTNQCSKQINTMVRIILIHTELSDSNVLKPQCFHSKWFCVQFARVCAVMCLFNSVFHHFLYMYHDFNLYDIIFNVSFSCIVYMIQHEWYSLATFIMWPCPFKNFNSPDSIHNNAIFLQRSEFWVLSFESS